MFNFFYHIPSAMPKDKWTIFPHAYNDAKTASRAAILMHYRGSVYPEEIEIWIRRKSKGNSQISKINRFHAREAGDMRYEIERILEVPVE